MLHIHAQLNILNAGGGAEDVGRKDGHLPGRHIILERNNRHVTLGMYQRGCIKHEGAIPDHSS